MDFGEMLTIFQNENNTELCGLIRDCITPITKLNVALQKKKAVFWADWDDYQMVINYSIIYIKLYII